MVIYGKTVGPTLEDIGDTGMAKLQESNNLVDLTEFLATPDGKKASETFPGLVDWTKSNEGGIYGVCVDCGKPIGVLTRQDLLTFVAAS